MKPGEFIEINVTPGELGKAVYEAGPSRHWEVTYDGETWVCWPYEMCGPLSQYRDARLVNNHEQREPPGEQTKKSDPARLPEKP